MRTPEYGLPLAVPDSAEPFDLLPVGIAELSSEGSVLRLNRALRDLLSQPGGSLPGRPGRRLDDLGWIVADDDRAALLVRLLAGVGVTRADGATWADGAWDHSGPGRLLRLRHRDGTELFVRVRARPARTADPAVAFVVVVVDVTEEHRHSEQLREQREHYRILADHVGDVVLVHRGHEIVWASPSVAFVLGRQPHSLVGRTLADLGDPKAVGELLPLPEPASSVTRRLRLRHADGTNHWFQATITARRSHTGPPTVYAWLRDIDEQVRAERGLAESERRLRVAFEDTAEMRATLQTALDATSDGFAVYSLEWDDAGRLSGLRVLHTNAAGAESLGLEADDMIGMELREFFPEADASGLWDRIVLAATTKAPQHHRVHVFDTDGGWESAWDNTVAPVGEERMAITWRNVSAEESALRQLARTRDEAMYSATHDALTNLPNRVLLRQHLHEALHDCLPEERVGLVFVDLDRFKAINDTYGHAAGDVVLKETAARLSRMVRHGDLAARLAGDEFVLVLTALAPDWSPDHFFARASALLSEPVWADGVQLHPAASLGAVLADPCQEKVDVDGLIKRADAAMYRAKAAARRG